MRNLRFTFFTFFTMSLLMSQSVDELPSESSLGISRWSYDGFSYADFGTQEQHSYFSVMYRLSPKLQAELQGFYDTYRTADIFDISLRLKWYPSEKMYLFSGVGLQIEQKKVLGESPVLSMPMRVLNGVGYELNDAMQLEAVHDLNFNANSSGSNGIPSLLKVKGKYRF